jgi:hypothetical protein
MTEPSFLLTIDTEGDNLWSRPQRVTTNNAAFLERFQLLCERHGLRPTWLTNYEMIMSPTFRRFAADVLARGTAEIGMHLHAWDSPPLVTLTPSDGTSHPYLIEYPPSAMRQKIRQLTALLEDSLGVKMMSHRAGRWAFDERYAQMLVDEGYKVDCSVTPFVSWTATPGAPGGKGGSDYVNFPRVPYWVDLCDISKPGESPLLEVPVTIVRLRSDRTQRLVDAASRLPSHRSRLSRPIQRAANRVSPSEAWLRPSGKNLPRLLKVIDKVRQEGLPYGQFMIHSSELMPGGSPTFRSGASIEKLYRDLEVLFEKINRQFEPATLSEFYLRYAESRTRGIA